MALRSIQDMGVEDLMEEFGVTREQVQSPAPCT